MSTPSQAPSVERRAPPPARRLRRWLLHLVGVLHRWAESGWGGSAVGTWGLLQASVVPGPTDALIAPLVLADPAKAYRLAAWAIAGSTLGGLIAFGIGFLLYEEIGLPLLHLFGIGPEQLASSRELFGERGWMLILAAGFGVTPSAKVFFVVAGALGMPFLEFGAVLFGARTARFLALATVLRFAGGRIAERIERKLGRPISSLR